MKIGDLVKTKEEHALYAIILHIFTVDFLDDYAKFWLMDGEINIGPLFLL